MKRQPLAANCAQHALQAAFVMLGKAIPLSYLHILSSNYIKTVFNGTSPKKILSMINKLNYNYLVHSTYSSKRLLTSLNNELQAGNPCIISSKNGKHWETVIGYQDDSFIIFNGHTIGSITKIYTSKQLLKRMVSEEGEDYYFIAIENKGISLTPKLGKMYLEFFANQYKWYDGLIALQAGKETAFTKYLSQLYKPT
jgi:hypothetical protein